jgi:lactoylglutathione lyase
MVAMGKAIRSRIRVLDEARSLAFCQQQFDEADFEIELTINKGRVEPYELGTAHDPIAFAVDDLDAEHARFKALGYAPRDIKEFKPDAAVLARFFFVDDPDGYKIGMLQRHGRYR